MQLSQSALVFCASTIVCGIRDAVPSEVRMELPGGVCQLVDPSTAGGPVHEVCHLVSPTLSAQLSVLDPHHEAQCAQFT